MVGVRTFGFQAPYTLHTEEANRRGAEIEEINLDRGYTRDRESRIYKEFCRKVVARRLIKTSLLGHVPIERTIGRLSTYFETVSAAHDEQLIIGRDTKRERPYLQLLRNDLSNIASSSKRTGS